MTMPYREELDAALARVDALERDNRDLESTAATLREDLLDAQARRPAVSPAPSGESRSSKAASLAFTACVAGFFGFTVALAVIQQPPPTTPPHHEQHVQLEKRSLEIGLCLNTIGPPPQVAGTFRSRQDIEAVQRTAAPCREDLPRLIAEAEGPWQVDDALHTWQETEAELANRIALIVAQKESDPLEEYAHPEMYQLWSEYERTLARRDAAIAMYSIALRRARENGL
jgi:hypothetical protein